MNALKNLIANLTEYHGRPVTIEYLLTGDIARALMARGTSTAWSSSVNTERWLVPLRRFG